MHTVVGCFALHDLITGYFQKADVLCIIWDIFIPLCSTSQKDTAAESQPGCQGQPVRATSHKLRQLLPSGTVGNKAVNTAHMKNATKEFLT